MRVLVLWAVVACGSRPAPPGDFAPRPADAGTVPIALPSDAAIDPAIDHAPADALARDAATRECFCFSWVHRDENGETCRETAVDCDAAFRSFGRNDKLPCRPATRAECASYACRGGGAECFRL